MTVDWVVLTAAITGFGAVLALGIGEATTAPADSIGNYLATMPVADASVN